ncbi:MAG TPA: polysaccharide pyruvyl transferase family protein [Euzebyales bacterium]|nr:polysaccharide pyruvyl transferase family protein [Euzebyales bacterium]
MRVTVTAWIGSVNAGDELIFAALRDKLLARGTHVTAISTRPAAGRDTGVTDVGHLAPAAVLGAIRSSDALIFGGGGLLQDRTSPFNLPYHLSRLAVARATGTPRAVIGVGAGPLRTTVGRAQVRAALRGTTAVSVRDRGSVEVLRRTGVRDVRLAADLALSLPAPSAAAEDRICACLRPWRPTQGRLPAGTRSRRDVTAPAMVDRLARGLDDAARRLGLPVRLVAMQPGWDDLLHARVAERMHADVSLVSPPTERVLDVIAASRVVVAMRYHAAIGAVLAGRPATLIGYDGKLVGIAEAMGPAARLLEWAPADLNLLGAATAGVADEGADLPGVLADLRMRERVNDTVLDDVLDVAEARR